MSETKKEMIESPPPPQIYKSDVCVIGGGITGLMTAYFLSRSGLTVNIVDNKKSARSKYGSSPVFARSLTIPHYDGYLFPKCTINFPPFTKKIPLSMLNLFPWRWSVSKNATGLNFQEKWIKKAEQMEKFGSYCYNSLREVEDQLKLPNLIQKQKGFISVYEDDFAFENAIDKRQIYGNVLKYSTKVFSREELLKLEPKLTVWGTNIIGGLGSPVDLIINAPALKKAITEIPQIQIFYEEEARTLKYDDKSPDLSTITSLQTLRNEFVADKFVLCLGGSTPRFLDLQRHSVQKQKKASKFEHPLPILPMKYGVLAIPVYRNTLNDYLLPSPNYSPPKIKKNEGLPPLDEELKLPSRPWYLDKFSARTFPQNETLVVTSEPHFSTSSSLTSTVIDDLIKVFQQLYPSIPYNYIRDSGRAQLHFAAYTPDSLPVISGYPGFQNLYLNTGHNHLNWTNAFGAGKLCSQLIQKQKHDYDIAQFDIKRFAT